MNNKSIGWAVVTLESIFLVLALVARSNNIYSAFIVFPIGIGLIKSYKSAAYALLVYSVLVVAVTIYLLYYRGLYIIDLLNLLYPVLGIMAVRNLKKSKS